MTVNKNSLTRVALFTLAALAGLFTVLSVTALASRQKTHRDLENLLQRYQVKDNAEDDPQNDAPGDKEGQEKPKPPLHRAQAERINKRHFFAAAKPEAKFSAILTGVLGRQAFFQGDDKPYELGQEFKGAKITQIGPDYVEIEFKGDTQTLYVFGKGGAKSSPSAPAPPSGPGRNGRSRPPGRPPMPSDVEITPERIEMFKKMPPDMRQKILESLPAEMREKVESQL